MLTQICAKLKNYFCREDDKIIGDFAIVGGIVTPSVDLQEGQYYRIVGSIFNDGVHKYGRYSEKLKDEPQFHGAIWKMRVPNDVLALAEEIAAWQEKYGALDSQNMSPFTSESFGGYSYNKGYQNGSSNGSTNTSWENAFATRLAPYMRIRV